MKRNNIILNKQNFNLSLLRLLLLFGVFGMFISCEVEDDMPPPSAWVEPEPVEGCVQLVGVPEISEGIDFECEYPEIVVFGEAAGSITIEPADNPDKEGINTSDKVMMVTQTSGVEGWAGFSFVLDSKVDFSEKQTIKVKVYSPAEDQTILLKLEDKTDSSISKEVPATTTVANEWEELSFVFSPGDSDKFDRLVLFFNFNGDKDGATVHYFDDIVQVEGGSTQEPGGSPDPTSAPPAPTAAAGDVQSIFSDSYTDPAGVNYFPNWGQSTTFEILDFDGNEVIKYGNANYQGIEFGETLDLTSYATLSIDVWSGDYTSIPIFLISEGSGEKSVDMDVTPNQWNTIKIPLEKFTSQGLDISDIIQIKFAVESAGGNFYIDNLYFSKAATAPSTAPNAPTKASTDVASIFSDSYTDPAGVNYFPNWGQSTTFEMLDFDGNGVIKYGNVNYQGIDFGETLDLSSYTTLNIDVWSMDYTSIEIFLISPGPVEKSVTLDVTPTGWNTIEVPLEDFISQGLDISAIFQIKFVVETAGGDFYIDNLYFSSEAASDCVSETAENIDPANGPINWTFKTDDEDHEFDQFGNVETDIVANPVTDGINQSCSVQMLKKTVGCETWSGLGQAIPTAIDFTTADKKIFKLKVLAQDQLAAVTLRLEKEPYPNVDPAEERVAEITEVGVWQELTFDFSDVNDKTFRSIIIYFERDVACDGDVYYFDDLVQTQE